MNKPKFKVGDILVWIKFIGNEYEIVKGITEDKYIVDTYLDGELQDKNIRFSIYAQENEMKLCPEFQNKQQFNIDLKDLINGES